MKFEKINIQERIKSFVPYLATFYYVEIIYLMIFMNFLYGKIVAAGTGIFLSLFLTFHVLRLFNRKDINRKIQIYCMDIHFAYSLAYAFNRFFSAGSLSIVEYGMITFRLITAVLEIIFVIILTDVIIRSEYVD